MRASVIVRSKDEADRLRLTLASLAAQTEKAEVVVVNDGSADATATVMAEAAGEMDLVAVHHTKALGRSSAANAGAMAATGDILIFLDGDTLAAPDFVAGHLDAHRSMPNLCVRGETWHLRCTRFFLDPERGTPKPGEEMRVERMSAGERARSIVTRQEIQQSFETIDRRAQPGVYPGFGPGRLFELEMDALRNHPACPVLWAAASGSNQSMTRSKFLESDGFHPELSINEHRELALRLCEGGGLKMAATCARTYHLIHRSGWRDPLSDADWEQIFYHAHPIPEVALLSFFWASLSASPPFPSSACIHSLPELAATAGRYRDLDGLKSVRDAHLRATVGDKFIP